MIPIIGEITQPDNFLVPFPDFNLNSTFTLLARNYKFIGTSNQNRFDF